MSETETHRNKVALTAALVVALIALAGVGYAATGHTFEGKTASATQEFDTDFVIVKLNTDDYTATTKADSNLHAVWNTITTYSDSAWQTQYKLTDKDSITYSVLVDNASTVENETLTLSAQLGATFSSTGYVLKCTVNSVEYTLTNANFVTLGNIVKGTAVDVVITVEQDTSAGTAGTEEGYRVYTTAPVDPVNIPAITFKVTGEQTHS